MIGDKADDYGKEHPQQGKAVSVDWGFIAQSVSTVVVLVSMGGNNRRLSHVRGALLLFGTDTVFPTIIRPP